MALSLRAMRYVQAALRRGSISAAAEEMNVAASAVATALNQAEESFGATLVTRARAKGISPTLTGRDVLRRIDDVLERYDAMISEMSDLQTGLSGLLTIAYNAPIAPAFLPQIAARLRATHPEISLSFIDGDNRSVQEDLLAGQCDAILFVEELPNPQIETEALLFAPTYCLCPADHPMAQQEAVTIAQILREPLVLLDRPAARGYYLDLLEQGGADVNIVATTNSTEMVRSLVASGTGVSLLSMRPGAQPPYAGGETRCLPIAGARHGVTLSLGFAPGPKRRVLQLFVETCIAFFQSNAAQNLIVAQ
ncbi:MAG: LysR family transcriptional regulator [Pseudomonadota bacterium]